MVYRFSRKGDIMSAVVQLDKIKQNLIEYPNVRIIAATKYFNIDKMNELIDAGINEVGENRKDSFLEKYEQLKDKNNKIIFYYKIFYTNRRCINWRLSTRNRS